MGWLFSTRWPTRKDLVTHLTSGNGMTTVKKAFSGNHLWCVHEHEGDQFICLYLMSKGPKEHGGPNWGYKDVDESMGPAYYTCPVSFLDEAQPEPTTGYAVEWRAEVRRRAAFLKSLTKGVTLRWREDSYVESDIYSFQLLQRRSPSCFVARGDNGNIYRLGKRVLNQMEVM